MKNLIMMLKLEPRSAGLELTKIGLEVRVTVSDLFTGSEIKRMTSHADSDVNHYASQPLVQL